MVVDILHGFFEAVIAANFRRSTAACFGTIHSLVGFAHQSRERIGVFGIQGKTNAGGAFQGFCAYYIRLLERVCQAFRQLLCNAGRHIRYQSHEFVATRPADDVAG